MPAIDHKPGPLPSLITIAVRLNQRDRCPLEAIAVRDAADRIRALESRLASVRAECEKELADDSAPFIGRKAVAESILSIIDAGNLSPNTV